MKSIFDHFLRSQRASFRPANMDELFAFRLAQKLNDAAAASHYVNLLSDHSIEQFLSAYRRALKCQQEPLATQFHSELGRGNGRLPSPERVRLIAVKVERRSIAAAVYDSRHPEHFDVRSLSSSSERAQSSAIGFINWILSNYEIQSAALELMPTGKDIRRNLLNKAILDNCILNHDVSLWPVQKQELLQAFGHPALRSRKELREVILSIWPDLKDHRGSEQLLDAAALGALVQTDRLFLN